MIAIIAGTGNLPLEACNVLRGQKKPFFVVSLFPEDNIRSLQQAAGSGVPVIAEQYFKAGKIIQQLKKNHASQVLLIGKVDKRNLLKKIKLDWFAVKSLASILYNNDSTIMQKVVDLLTSYGMHVIKQDDILGALKVDPGILCGAVNDELKHNIKLGMNTAQQLSACDIGQTVIVKNRMILAVEAIEGTDECIRRGITLGNGNVIICKAAQPQQNKQFDLPTLGPQTLENIKPGDVQAIAWLSSHTLIAQRSMFMQQAKNKHITLVSVKG